MRIFELTNVGFSTTEVPPRDSNIRSDILYYMKRHNGRTTDDDIKNKWGLNNFELRDAVRKLKDSKMIVEL